MRLLSSKSALAFMFALSFQAQAAPLCQRILAPRSAIDEIAGIDPVRQWFRWEQYFNSFEFRKD